MNGTDPVYDIAIVGPVPMEHLCLARFLYTISKGHGPFRILVVESNQDLGSGMLYSKYMTIPEHIVNIAGGCTQGAATFYHYLKDLTFCFGYAASLRSTDLKFVPFQGAEEFKMTMYQRKAILPQVMGVVVNKIFKHKYLTPEFFIPIIEANGGFLLLDDFWYLLKKEVYDEVPRLRPHLPDCWETLSLEEAVSEMRKLLQTTDPVDRLSRELGEAKESLKTGVRVLLQNLFYQSYAVFDEAFNYFSAEDRIRFEEMKTEVHLLIGPFPVQNAEKILAIMKDGYLEVKSIGTNYEIEEAKDKSCIKLSWKAEGVTTSEAYEMDGR